MNCFFCDLFFFQQVFHHLLIKHRDRFQHFLTLLLSVINHVRRDLLLTDSLAVVSIKEVGLHGHQVHHAVMILFQTNGKLHGNRVQTKDIANPLDPSPRICTHPVQLVDEG